MGKILMGIGAAVLILGTFLLGGRDMFKSREERHRNARKKWGKIDYVGFAGIVLGLVIVIIGNAI